MTLFGICITGCVALGVLTKRIRSCFQASGSGKASLFGYNWLK